MKRLLSLFSLILSVSLSSCGSNKPSCSDQETTKILKQIIEQNAIGILRMAFGEINYSIEDIITIAQTERKAECKFSLILSMTNGEGKKVSTNWSDFSNTPTTYTVEKTDDGKLYVTAYGLKG